MNDSASGEKGTISPKLGFPGGSAAEHLLANSGDARDAGSAPGLGRALDEGTATHSSILSWSTPWTEEPGGLQSMR